MQRKNLKVRSCRQPPIFPRQSSFVLCLRSSAFLIVDLTSHGQWHLFQVRRQPPCSDGFPCLGSHCSSLANPTVAKLQLQGAKTVLRSCAGYLAHLSPGFCSNSVCRRIAILGPLPATIVHNGPKKRLCSATK